jgi:hypothetical protein
MAQQRRRSPPGLPPPPTVAKSEAQRLTGGALSDAEGYGYGEGQPRAPEASRRTSLVAAKGGDIVAKGRA